MQIVFLVVNMIKIFVKLFQNLIVLVKTVHLKKTDKQMFVLIKKYSYTKKD